MATFFFFLCFRYPLWPANPVGLHTGTPKLRAELVPGTLPRLPLSAMGPLAATPGSLPPQTNHPRTECHGTGQWDFDWIRVLIPPQTLSTSLHLHGAIC